MFKRNYLPGLNSLRLIAAVLVILGHAKEHLLKLNIIWHSEAPVLRQAGSAVKFFFVLSGFLLTMIAIREIEKYGKIDLKSFYLRRILRIFPLYYLVLITYTVINAFINPILLHKNTLGQPLIPGFLLNTFMFPNLGASIWPQTVGALGLLWSIGVEEQFYLFFPHLMNFLSQIKYKILFLLFVFVCVFAFYQLVKGDILPFNPTAKRFVNTLRFDYMLIGSIFSYIVFATKKASNFILSIINNKIAQLVVYLVAIADIFFGFMPGGFIRNLAEPAFFAVVIISVSCTTKPLLAFERKPFTHWGAISYGMYLLHPLVAYVLRFLFIKISFVKNVITTYPDLYGLILVVLTIGLAHLSYKYYETPFLKLKDKMNKEFLMKVLNSRKHILSYLFSKEQVGK